MFGWEWSALIGAARRSAWRWRLDRSEPIKVAFNSADLRDRSRRWLALAAARSTAAVATATGSSRCRVVIGGAIFVLANVLDRLRRDRAFATGTPGPRVFMRPPAPVGADLRDHGLRRGAGGDLLARLARRSCCCSSAPLFALTLYQRSSVAARRRRGGGVDRQPDRPQEPARVRGRGGRRPRRCVARRHRTVRALPDRHRPLQAGQRPPRAPRPATRSSRRSAARSRRPHPAAATGSAATSSCCSSSGTARRGARRAGREAAARVRRAAARRRPAIEPVTISAGIAVYPEHADDLHSLQKRADMALYQSKYNGRDRSTVYTGRPRGGETRTRRLPRPRASRWRTSAS